MVTRAQHFRWGVFLIISISLFIILIIVVGGNKLVEKRDKYYIKYRDFSVSGLEAGGAVKYHGINIGRVEDISIDSKDISQVIVEFSVKAGTPIKEDVTAQLVFAGITGLKQIELAGGTNKSAMLAPGSQIKTVLSTIDNISGKAGVLLEKFELLINQLNKLTSDENSANFSNLLANTAGIVDENRQSFQNIMTHLDSMGVHLTEITKQSALTIKQVNKYLLSAEIEKIFQNSVKFSDELAAADMTAILNELHGSLKSANAAFTHIDLTLLRSRHDILRIFESMREASEYLNEFARQINDDPRLLLREAERGN